MIYLLGSFDYAIIAFIGILFAFAVTCIAIAGLNKYLPKDMGRQYAHDGSLSAGKPRGAGIIFIFVFVAAALLFECGDWHLSDSHCHRDADRVL